jgi:hypothetical protein
MLGDPSSDGSVPPVILGALTAYFFFGFGTQNVVFGCVIA